MKFLHIIIIAGLVFFFFSCKKEEKPEKNRVDIDQINYDETNNYKFIFKDTIDEEKRRKSKYKKKPDL
jgi:hypothetical protein